MPVGPRPLTLSFVKVYVRVVHLVVGLFREGNFVF